MKNIPNEEGRKVLENNQRGELLEAIAKLKKARSFVPPLEGIPHGEFIMMHMIDHCIKEKNDNSEEPGVKISALSTHLHMSKPAASQMLNSLEKKGYIERKATQSDRRVVFVNLTANGYVLLEEIQQKYLELLNEILEKFSETDVKTLISLLNKLYDIMEQIKESK